MGSVLLCYYQVGLRGRRPFGPACYPGIEAGTGCPHPQVPAFRFCAALSLTRHLRQAPPRRTGSLTIPTIPFPRFAGTLAATNQTRGAHQANGRNSDPAQLMMPVSGPALCTAVSSASKSTAFTTTCLASSSRANAMSFSSLHPASVSSSHAAGRRRAVAAPMPPVAPIRNIFTSDWMPGVEHSTQMRPGVGGGRLHCCPMTAPSVVWFRQDLRLADNLALLAAAQRTARPIAPPRA